MRFIPLSLLVVVPSLLFAGAGGSMAAKDSVVVTLPPVMVEGSRSPEKVYKVSEVSAKPLPLSEPHVSPLPKNWPKIFLVYVSYVVDETGKVWNPQVTRLELDRRVTEKDLRTALGKDAAALKTIDELRSALGVKVAEHVSSSLRKWTYIPGKIVATPVAVQFEERMLMLGP